MKLFDITEDGTITANFLTLVASLEDAAQIQLGELLVKNEVVLDHFVEKLGREIASETLDPELHHARMKMIELMPEAAANVIRALVAENVRVTTRAERIAKDNSDLVGQWPYVPGQSRPKPREYENVSTPSTDVIMKRCSEIISFETAEKDVE